jgi:hypothetical protein
VVTETPAHQSHQSVWVIVNHIRNRKIATSPPIMATTFK